MTAASFLSFRALVLNAVRAGYDAEDIAHRNGVSADKVRDAIADLREWGLIANTDWQGDTP